MHSEQGHVLRLSRFITLNRDENITDLTYGAHIIPDKEMEFEIRQEDQLITLAEDET